MCCYRQFNLDRCVKIENNKVLICLSLLFQSLGNKILSPEIANGLTMMNYHYQSFM